MHARNALRRMLYFARGMAQSASNYGTSVLVTSQEHITILIFVVGTCLFLILLMLYFLLDYPSESDDAGGKGNLAPTKVSHALQHEKSAYQNPYHASALTYPSGSQRLLLPGSAQSVHKPHQSASGSYPGPSQPMPRRVPPQPTSPLCPELVVPPDHECTLVIPKESSLHWAAGRTGGFQVMDMDAKPVLHFSMIEHEGKPSISQHGGELVAPRLTLTSANGGPVLAYCCARPGATGPFFVYRQEGELFATLDCVPERQHVNSNSDIHTYVLADRGGSKLLLHFPMDPAASQIRIMNDQALLCATVEPTSADAGGKTGSKGSDCGLIVRISPRVDVAALLCAFLCSLQLLKLERQASESAFACSP